MLTDNLDLFRGRWGTSTREPGPGNLDAAASGIVSHYSISPRQPTNDAGNGVYRYPWAAAKSGETILLDLKG
jgi:hypothetical protein